MSRPGKDTFPEPGTGKGSMNLNSLPPQVTCALRGCGGDRAHRMPIGTFRVQFQAAGTRNIGKQSLWKLSGGPQCTDAEGVRRSEHPVDLLWVRRVPKGKREPARGRGALSEWRVSILLHATECPQGFATSRESSPRRTTQRENEAPKTSEIQNALHPQRPSFSCK